MEKILKGSEHNNDIISGDLLNLQQEILVLSQDLPVEKIGIILENHSGTEEELIDKLYDILCDRKDFKNIAIKYQKELKYPLGSMRSRELFYYLFDHGYVLSPGNISRNNAYKLLKYETHKFEYKYYPQLGQLFQTTFTGGGNYYSFEDSGSEDVGFARFDRAFINKSYINTNRESTITNELMHTHIFKELYMSQKELIMILPDGVNELLSDITSVLTDPNYFSETLVFAFTNRFFPDQGISQYAVQKYKITYDTFIDIFFEILGSQEQIEKFQQIVDHNRSVLRDNAHGRHINYAELTRPLIFNQYHDVIKNNMSLIQLKMLSIGQEIIGSFKDEYKKIANGK